MDKLSDEEKSKLYSQLTQRQREIVSLLCSGDLTNREIGKKMDLEENSVKVYLNSIYDKLLIEGEGVEKRENLRREYCYLATGQVYVPPQPVYIPLEPEDVSSPAPDITEKTSVASPEPSQTSRIDRRPTPAHPRRRAIVLGVGLIAIIILFFVFRGGGDPTETPTEVAQVAPTSLPTEAPTIAPTITPLPTNTPTITTIPTETPTITPKPTQKTQGLGLFDKVSSDDATLSVNKDGFSLAFTDHNAKWMAGFLYMFENRSSGERFLQTTTEHFRVVDNLDREYRCVFSTFRGFKDAIEQTLKAGEKAPINLVCGENLTPTEDITSYTVYITGLSNLPDSSWFLEIPR